MTGALTSAILDYFLPPFDHTYIYPLEPMNSVNCTKVVYAECGEVHTYEPEPGFGICTPYSNGGLA